MLIYGKTRLPMWSHLPSSRRGDTLWSSSSVSSFHPQRKWWLCFVAAVLVMVLAISLASSHSRLHRHVRSPVVVIVERPDDGHVWTIGGYTMKIDPQMLTVVEHDNGAVSIIKTNYASLSQREEDNAKTDAFADETGPVAAAERLL